MPDDKSKDSKFKSMRNMGIAVTIPMVLVSGPIIGYFIGTWLDNRFDTAPWLFIIFIILGLVAGLRQTIRLIREISRNDD